MLLCNSLTSTQLRTRMLRNTSSGSAILGRPLPIGGDWEQVGRTEIEDDAWAIMKDYIHTIIIHSYISFGSDVSRSSTYIIKLYYILFTDCSFIRHIYESPAAIHAKTDQRCLVY